MIKRMDAKGPNMEIVVVGMGYVGIPAAALFANVEGIRVTGVQRRSKRSGWKIDHLNAGKSPIGGDEPGLEELIGKVVREGKFRVTDDTSVYETADAILIDVQTPVDEDHVPRYESLRQVSADIGRNMKEGALVVLESTVAPGTTKFVVRPILEEHSGMKAGVDFNLAYSYERVMVGRLLYNLQHMPRVVGGLTPECTRRGVDLYRVIVKAEILPTDCLTAEVAKVTENTYRDVNVAFANEIAIVCESLNINVHDVRRLVNSLPFDPSNPRKNPYRNLHIPGGGVGGHCLPKDPWLLKHGLDAYGSFGFEPKIIQEPFGRFEVDQSASAHQLRPGSRGEQRSAGRNCLNPIGFVSQKPALLVLTASAFPAFEGVRLARATVLVDELDADVFRYSNVHNVTTRERDVLSQFMPQCRVNSSRCARRDRRQTDRRRG